MRSQRLARSVRRGVRIGQRMARKAKRKAMRPRRATYYRPPARRRGCLLFPFT